MFGSQFDTNQIGTQIACYILDAIWENVFAPGFTTFIFDF